MSVPLDASPGHHILTATQDYTDDKGVTTAAYGTPARASFLVLGAAVQPVAPPAAVATTTPPPASSGGNGALIALMVFLGIGGFALFAAGVAVAARQVRRRPVPAPVEKQ